MAIRLPEQKRLNSLLWDTLREEWKTWLAIAILLSVMFLHSDQIDAWFRGLVFINVLDSLNKLGVLIVVIVFLRKIPKWEERLIEESKRRQFEYWKTIDAAKVAREESPDGRYTSYALRIALENLAKEQDAQGKHIEMWEIDVSGANLNRADLENADFYMASFNDTDLSGANFRRTRLHRTKFYRARLFGTDFREASFLATVFRYALYDDATKFPDGFNPEEAMTYRIAPGASLRKANLIKAQLWDANLEGSDLQGADLSEALIGGVKGNLQSVNFQDANLQGVRARNADLRGAILQNANLQGSFLDNAKLSGADLSNADFRKVKFITVEQIKSAKNWEQAIYDDEFRKELGLLP